MDKHRNRTMKFSSPFNVIAQCHAEVEASLKSLGRLMLATLLFAISSHAHAGLILSPIAVESNTLGQINSTFGIGNVIDQSGLSASFNSGVDDFDNYLVGAPTQGSALPNYIWGSSSGTTTGSIIFDLGAEFVISQIVLWQGGETPVTSVNSIGFDTSSTVDFSTNTAVGDFNAASQTSLTEPHQLFDLTDSTGRFVRLNILSNHGHPSITTLGEIAFDVTAPAAVPVPAAVWLFGSALMGLVAMRKRKIAA